MAIINLAQARDQRCGSNEIVLSMPTCGCELRATASPGRTELVNEALASAHTLTCQRSLALAAHPVDVRGFHSAIS